MPQFPFYPELAKGAEVQLRDQLVFRLRLSRHGDVSSPLLVKGDQGDLARDLSVPEEKYSSLVAAGCRLCRLGRFSGLGGFRRSAASKSWSVVPAGAVLRPAGERKSAPRRQDRRRKTGELREIDGLQLFYETGLRVLQTIPLGRTPLTTSRATSQYPQGSTALERMERPSGPIW
jgi:hypothetical protein